MLNHLIFSVDLNANTCFNYFRWIPCKYVFLECTSGNPFLLLESRGWTELSKILLPHFPLQAECIKTGVGTHTCVCQQGWTGDGRDCSEINNCQLPNSGGCHDNATCLYLGPGQVGVLRQRTKEALFPIPFRHRSASGNHQSVLCFYDPGLGRVSFLGST